MSLFFVKKQITEPLSTNFIDVLNILLNTHVFLGKDGEEEVSLDSDSDTEFPEEDEGLSSISFCFLKL